MHKGRMLIRASVVAASMAAPLSHLTCAPRNTAPEIILPPPIIEERAPEERKPAPSAPGQNEEERREEQRPRQRLTPPDEQERENLRLMLASLGAGGAAPDFY
ncbi:MAG: hypothetical protein AB1324_06760 [Candidatus Micrarchaeota archaeon]